MYNTFEFMENETNSPKTDLKFMTSNSEPFICTNGLIQDYYFNLFLIIDQLPFDFEFEHTELFGFID